MTLRLPLLVSLLLALVLALYLSFAFRQVEQTLLSSAGVRLQNSAGQVAGLLSQSTQQRMAELRRIAANPALASYLATQNDETRKAAERALDALGGGPGQQTVELWNAEGARVLLLTRPSKEGRLLPSGTAPPRAGISPLRQADGAIFSEGVVDIPGGGALTVRRPTQLTPPDLLNRLVGPQARVIVGNMTGDVWTDFSEVVSSLSIDTARPNIAQDTSAGGTVRLGVLAPMTGTPWGVWVDLPRDAIVAPAYAFLRRMAIVGVVFVAIAAAVVQASTAALKRSRRQAQQDLDRFFSLSLDLLCIADLDGRFKRVNPAWTDALGWSARELTGVPYADFVHPDDRAATDAAAAGLAKGASALNFENRYRAKDGSYRWLNWKAATGEGDLIYAAARDVTDAKRASAELQRANAAKSTFLSHMSHDLRTPLNAVLGFAQLLDNPNLDEERRDHVRQILSAGQHLLDLITEVLDISRIESGQLALSLEPVGVRDVVERSVALVGPLAAPTGVTVHIDHDIAHTSGVFADRQRLKQILLNLLSNAVKYNRPGGQVRVGAERAGADRVRIRVSDTGLGIPAEKQALLFQAFERLGAEQTGVEGTGLGLALVRALAEAMGGSVGVDSIVNHGSTFWVELASASLPEYSPAVAAAEATAPAPVPARRATVFYIEDNASNLRLMQGILRQRPSIDLRHAPTGGAGLEMIDEDRPDLVLLDLHLPDMSGEEVVRRLRANPHTATIPVIIATADASPGVTRRMQAAGATACLSKPLDIQRVLELVDEHTA